MIFDWALMEPVISSIKASLELGKVILIKDKNLVEQLKQKEIVDKLSKMSNQGNIIFINGDHNQVYITNWEKISSQNKEDLLKQFSNDKNEEVKKEINIIDQEFSSRIQHFRNAKSSDRKIEKIFPFLEPEYRNILRLAIYVKELYNDNNPQEASLVKMDIGYQYGKEGRKLCNLYSNEYIVTMIDFLFAYHDGDEAKVGVEISRRISELVKKPIFYIHQRYQISTVVTEIYLAFHRKESYIAIHAAGQNIKNAEEIVQEITEKAKEYGYDFSVAREKTLSQTPVYNVIIKPKG